MKLSSIFGALSAAILFLAASAAEAKHSAAAHTTPSGIHFLNPQPLPPG